MISLNIEKYSQIFYDLIADKYQFVHERFKMDSQINMRVMSR